MSRRTTKLSGFDQLTSSQYPLVATRYAEFCAVPLDKEFEYRDIRDVVTPSTFYRAARRGLVVPTGYVSGHDRKGTHRWRASNSLKVIINYIEQKRQELYEKNRQDPAQASGSV